MKLPYYVDGDIKLTQSNAILRYIARKHNLIGTTEKEIERVDLMENEIGDFRMGFVMLCYNPNFVSKLILFSKFKLMINHFHLLFLITRLI